MNQFSDLLFLAAALKKTEALLKELDIDSPRAQSIALTLDQKKPGLAAFLQSIPEGRRLLAALELGRRFSAAEKPRLQTPVDALPFGKNAQSEAAVLLLDEERRLVQTLDVDLDSAVAVAAEAGVCALQLASKRLILVVKRPLEIEFILDVEERLQHLGIELVDVLSLSQRGYASLQSSTILKARSPWETSNAPLQPT